MVRFQGESINSNKYFILNIMGTSFVINNYFISGPDYIEFIYFRLY